MKPEIIGICGKKFKQVDTGIKACCTKDGIECVGLDDKDLCWMLPSCDPEFSENNKSSVFVEVK